MKQPQFTPLKTEEQVAIIFAGVNGYLDGIEVDQVREFEDGLLALLRGENQDLLNAIRDEGELSDALSDKLTAVLDAYAKNFA